jgi:hypothetical protein
MFNDLVSGQKKIPTPAGQSGKIQKKTLFHRFEIKEVLGLKATVSK